MYLCGDANHRDRSERFSNEDNVTRRVFPPWQLWYGTIVVHRRTT
jgi:hypothetical protein